MNERPTEEPQLDLELEEVKPIVDDAESRKARRAAILAQYQQKQATERTSNTSNTSNAANALKLNSALLEKINGSLLKVDSAFSTPPPSTPMETGAAPSPAAGMPEEEDFSLTKDQTTLNADQAADSDFPLQRATDDNGVAAADYDPSQDMREDVRRAAQILNDGALAGEEVSEYEDDEGEDVDDIFAIAGDEEKKPKKKRKVVRVSSYSIECECWNLAYISLSIRNL